MAKASGLHVTLHQVLETLKHGAYRTITDLDILYASYRTYAGPLHSVVYEP